MFRSLFSRSLAALLVIVMLATQFGTVALAESYIGTLPVDTGEKSPEEELAEVKALLSALSYQEYLDDLEVHQNGKDDILLTYDDVVADKTTDDVRILNAEELGKELESKYSAQIEVTDKMTPNAAGKTEEHNKYNKKYLEELISEAKAGMSEVDSVLITTASSELTFGFNIETEGFYSFEIEYMAASASSNNIERAIMVDGAYPYSETRSVLS